MNYSTDTLERFSALSAKQRRAIVALLAGKSHRGAAEAAGVGQATITRWKANEDFRAVREAMQDESAKAQLSGLAKLQEEAMEGLTNAVKVANLELSNPDGDCIAAAHFLERVAERAIAGYGIGPGGKVGAGPEVIDAPRVNIYLPSNGRDSTIEAQPEGREDRPDDILGRFKNAD